MPNVFSLIAPKRTLCDVCCLVPDSLQGATNDDEIEITANGFRALGGPGYESFAN
jgi:hypothetical protein